MWSNKVLKPNFVPVFMGLELYKGNFIFRPPRFSTLSAESFRDMHVWLFKAKVERNDGLTASYQGFDTVNTGVIEGLG